MNAPDTLHVFVPGIARPKGSMRAFMNGGKVVVTSDNQKLKGWSNTVHYHVSNEAKDQGWLVPFGGAMYMELRFVLPVPKRPKDVQHITKPDLDKLIRGVLDPMKGVIFADDSRVVKILAAKAYENGLLECGVHIMVSKRVP